MCTSPSAMAQAQGTPFNRLAQAIAISRMASTGNGAGLVRARAMNAPPPSPALGTSPAPSGTQSKLGS